MRIDAATLQVAILALPGLIWAMLDAATRHPSQSGQFIYVLRVFVFGVVTYAVLALGYRIVGRPFNAFELSVSETSFTTKTDEILWSIPLALALASLWIAGRTYSWLYTVLNKVNVSDHTGNSDIWEFSLSPASPVGGSVHVRDFAEKVVYSGYVRAYSDSPDLREILLVNASVYDFSGKEMYSKPAIYLARATDNIIVEFDEAEQQ
jgi:hypothetical protein